MLSKGQSGKQPFLRAVRLCCVNAFLPTAYQVLYSLAPAYIFHHLLSCSPSFLTTSSQSALLSVFSNPSPNSSLPQGLCMGCSWDTHPMPSSSSFSDLSLNALPPARPPSAAPYEAGPPPPTIIHSYSSPII